MTNFELIKYEELQKIEDINFITTLQKIKRDISDYHSQIPSRIICINLLRSICKFHASYFFNFFWGIRMDFFKNCLNYEQNPKLQHISLEFLNEVINNIFNEIPIENINDLIFWIYENIFDFLKNNNNILKSSAEKLIRDIAIMLPCEAIIICLIKSLKEKDENILDFIFKCLEFNFKEYASYGISFDYIIEDLEIDNLLDNKDFQDYYRKIKKAFVLFKNIYQSQCGDIALIVDDLEQKNKPIFVELIK